MKNNKGITLIALVITIIVLLILAGVSIAMLTGENGLLTKATDADSNTAKSQAADLINLELNDIYASILAHDTIANNTQREVSESGKEYATITITVNNGDYTVTVAEGDDLPDGVNLTVNNKAVGIAKDPTTGKYVITAATWE